jgi:REP element-mobilizing transposase RayT
MGRKTQPNHLHLLIETGRVPLAKIMQGIQQSYTEYFNRKYWLGDHFFQ